MKITKKILAVMLVFSMALIAGCSPFNQTWVYKNAQHTVSAGRYVAYQLEAFNLFAEKVQSTYATELAALPAVTYQSIMKFDIDEKSGPDWIADEAQRTSKISFAVEQESARLGISLAPQLEEAIEAQINDMWATASKDDYELNGIGKDSWIAYQRDLYLKNYLFASLYEEGGEQAVSKADLVSHFEKSYAIAKIVRVMKPTDHDPNHEGHVEEVVVDGPALAEEYKKRMDAGELAEDLMYEYMGVVIPAEQMAEVEYPTSADVTLVVDKTTEGANAGDTLREALVVRTDKAAFVHEMEDGYYVVKPIDLAQDEATYGEYQAMLLTDLKGEAFEEAMLAIANTMNIETNKSALNQYKPEKLKQPNQPAQ